ncbi:bifunctional riboflavin kinase/FAD synthetase [Pseudoclavibacter chungangensis]|uniref:Riboflavin biosynthesis protein n=1 Tax=Pseudoclavibacter chungangensis TaxID=587635 RepID=A0A7J5BSK5_9MICO|nr:bifunctional riboflavin kinase/FAD synthetase [Pseudoclavibacter chungangensis]KAB1657294.1 bifunctional riboflavin kinase/FAD synthetase [Pseudoclavibacter chungangensis]NYJ66259.1 riboflavin kinase/FMN adenylyltransferase [Pseudoclavibacter chungangensis]
MHVITDLDRVPADVAPSAITIGKFDGLHIGHVRLVERLRAEARERGLNPVVVTFDRHPASVFAPDRVPDPVVSPRQRLELLRRAGITATCVLAFDDDFAALSPLAFIRDVCVGALGARLFLVGRDFTFGARGEGNVDTLLAHADELGYEVVVADDETGPDGERASSTRVRELLAAGDVTGVARVLGRPHVVSGEVVHGAKRGRELGFPTANLDPDIEGLVPADGVYAGWFHDGESVYPTAISVGNNPTFEGVPQKQVEAFVIDAELDLYGHRVQLSFVERIRGMQRFDGVDDLVARMNEDVVDARRILGVPPSSGA